MQLIWSSVRAIKTCFSNFFSALFIFLYQYPVKKTIIEFFIIVMLYISDVPLVIYEGNVNDLIEFFIIVMFHLLYMRVILKI